MPNNSAKIKIQNVKNYNGDIVYCEPTEEKREEMMNKCKEEFGFEAIHPYNDINVILGQATCAYEVYNYCNE
jgi:threonine dehydratase